ncbi:hypothetical protein GCM10011316_17460 [Roseibium aquae]|uniref:DUF3540 domain-containing protein n=1 Tax=Roseibium aquae TaxID=1323746 RepID=A0A916WZM6_9HYPH|nr:DUF3540 domain-containing protein [Roseibium aquae]GGB45858.1 hypothetical protein GCM10011316_17460 [Roseibium aquae]
MTPFPQKLNVPVTAEDRPSEVPDLRTGTVTALVTGSQMLVRLDTDETCHAAQAAGCLLQPDIGDTVLLYRAPHEAYVLSVLTRGGDGKATLSVSGASHVALKAARQLDLAAPEVTVTARRLSLISETLTKTGKQLIQTFTKTLETTVDKFVSARTINTNAATRTSAIKETDTLQAGILVQNIDSVATQTSDISMVTAKEDVRLDAKRVSVG